MNALPHWSVSDVHESLQSRSFLAAMEACHAGLARLEALFDEHGIRAAAPRAVEAADGEAADAVIASWNEWQLASGELDAYIRATVSTDSYDESGQAAAGELATLEARSRPLLARLVDWVASLGASELAGVSREAAEHVGPLQRLAQRAEHQMDERGEALYAELSLSGAGAWRRLHADVTSRLTVAVELPDGGTRQLPMATVRGLAAHTDPGVRLAAYQAELRAWPEVALVCAAALNSIKGEANTVNRHRRWPSPLDASLYANNVSRAAFDAMQAAVQSVLSDFRRWMRVKARFHGRADALAWHDLVAPLPFAAAEVSWEDGAGIVRDAFSSYSQPLAGLVDRALAEHWIDAESRDGKRGGAFCMPFVGDRSLILLNWNGSVDGAQTMAHELGHAYHNTQLAARTPLQRRLPMALAETASIFCETLVVEAGLRRAVGRDRLVLLDLDLQGAAQVVVDIHSRFLFESELFARRQRRPLSVAELNELMRASQSIAYGDGLDQSTAHPYMWAVKPHYYNSHFYNWPYTYGLLFGLGLFAHYQDDPAAFRDRYDDLLSRVGIDTADELGRAFGLDVTAESFWMASIDVLRARIDEYEQLAANA